MSLPLWSRDSPRLSCDPCLAPAFGHHRRKYQVHKELPITTGCGKHYRHSRTIGLALCKKRIILATISAPSLFLGAPGKPTVDEKHSSILLSRPRRDLPNQESRAAPSMYTKLGLLFIIVYSTRHSSILYPPIDYLEYVVKL